VLTAGMLRRRGLPLALARIEPERALRLVDLDLPSVLTAQGLQPSRVATRRRDLTQPQALSIHASGADGIRWWSTLESLWLNATLFERAAPRLRLTELTALAPDHPAVQEALELLGIAPAPGRRG